MDLESPEGLRRAVAWQQAMIQGIADGGVWLVPRSGTIIQVNHLKKEAIFKASFVPEPDIKKVFIAMGWSVVDPASN